MATTYQYRESRRESRRAGKERATSSRSSRRAPPTRQSNKPFNNNAVGVPRQREEYLMTGANPFIEAAGTSRDYLAPGPRAQYPRPMTVYTHSQLGAGSSASDSGYYGSRETEVPLERRRSTTQRSRKRASQALWACPVHSITSMAIGILEVFRAVGAVSIGTLGGPGDTRCGTPDVFPGDAKRPMEFGTANEYFGHICRGA
ncbi:hypothetical protein PG997_014016 [Apiospora hydei]|uniref:Uncharacterized protein n=1 Tax=Apiospora hydei TaxID=1337664 RepID=A0ABR1V7U7_9PEZI